MTAISHNRTSYRINICRDWITRRAKPHFLLVSLLTCTLAASSAAGSRCRSYIGETPPELMSDAEDWIGAGVPLSLADLRGKVVWLQFNY